MPPITYYTNQELAKAVLDSDFDEVFAFFQDGFKAYANGDLIIPDTLGLPWAELPGKTDTSFTPE